MPSTQYPPAQTATRIEMIQAMADREDLLPSQDWPWTTEQMRGSYAKFLAEQSAAAEPRIPFHAIDGALEALWDEQRTDYDRWTDPNERAQHLFLSLRLVADEVRLPNESKPTELSGQARAALARIVEETIDDAEVHRRAIPEDLRDGGLLDNLTDIKHYLQDTEPAEQGQDQR